MGSNSKHPKIEEDRISNLPSSLISHILSLLPTKYAVRTSSLSTFWYNQWTEVFQLRFDDSLSPGIAASSTTKASFSDFVNRVLLHLKDVCPHIFQLHCSQDYGVTNVNSWVSVALSRRVKHMDLSFSIFDPGFLPRSLYSSRNLMVLKLGTGFLLKVPMNISLDSLKILHLSVKFSDNDSISRLVSSCPVLEDLKLQGIIDENVDRINISSVSLKRLILIGMNPLSDPPFYAYHLMLNTPCLLYLEHVRCRVPFSYSKDTLLCLDRAHIGLVCELSRVVPASDAPHRLGPPLSSMAVAISGIKFLYLTRASCKVFNYIYLNNFPKFPRLINLELEETDWRLLAAFLNRSPKLATLSLQYAYHYPWRSESFRVPPCTSSSDLKKIEIKNFRGEPKEVDIARYFIEKVKSLNKLLINYSLDITKEKEAEISKKLLMVLRASTSCEVLVT